jgi:hypothetical protein
MSQAVSGRPHVAEAQFFVWVSPCGICVGHWGTETGFSKSFLFSTVIIIPPWLSIEWLIDFDEVRPHLWAAATNGHIVHPPDDDISLERDGGMILIGGKGRNWINTCSSDTLSTTNPTRNDLGAKRASAVRGQRLTAWDMAQVYGCP